MAEGAPLLREYVGKTCIEGSNPSDSAKARFACVLAGQRTPLKAPYTGALLFLPPVHRRPLASATPSLKGRGHDGHTRIAMHLGAERLTVQSVQVSTGAVRAATGACARPAARRVAAQTCSMAPALPSATLRRARLEGGMHRTLHD